MAAAPRLSVLQPHLDRLVARYETPAFIENDPISIPHRFDDPRDREVIGLYAATLAWGRRSVILSKLSELCDRMDDRPYAFVRNFDASRDASRLEGFVHRTFQPIDALWFTRALSKALDTYESIEHIFADHLPPAATHVGPAIQGFSETMLSICPDAPERLRKHLARPDARSACKRLNMYLRWMVRPGPVDFGDWSAIHPDQLLLPLDTHAGSQARTLGLTTRKSTDWEAVREVTNACRQMAPADPARYDFALFGAGVSESDESLEDLAARAETVD
jgi:uncharacterized protein (TIGR02757 family)